MGDFNEPLTERSSMARIASAHGLMDILFQRNTNLPKPNTYAHRSTCIDYALISPDIAESVKLCGYEPFQYRFPGDHQGMFLAFNTNALFGSATVDLSTPTEREFNSRDQASNRRYIEAKFEYLTGPTIGLPVLQPDIQIQSIILHSPKVLIATGYAPPSTQPTK